MGTVQSWAGAHRTSSTDRLRTGCELGTARLGSAPKGTRTGCELGSARHGSAPKGTRTGSAAAAAAELCCHPVANPSVSPGSPSLAGWGKGKREKRREEKKRKEKKRKEKKRKEKKRKEKKFPAFPFLVSAPSLPATDQAVSPSSPLTLSSSKSAAVTKTIPRALPPQQKTLSASLHLQNINKQPESIKGLETQLQQGEWEELHNQPGGLRRLPPPAGEVLLPLRSSAGMRCPPLSREEERQSARDAPGQSRGSGGPCASAAPRLCPQPLPGRAGPARAGPVRGPGHVSAAGTGRAILGGCESLIGSRAAVHGDDARSAPRLPARGAPVKRRHRARPELRLLPARGCSGTGAAATDTGAAAAAAPGLLLYRTCGCCRHRSSSCRRHRSPSDTRAEAAADTGSPPTLELLLLPARSYGCCWLRSLRHRELLRHPDLLLRAPDCSDTGAAADTGAPARPRSAPAGSRSPSAPPERRNSLVFRGQPQKMSTCFPVLLANLCFTMAVERKDHMEVVKHLKKEQELKDAGREENCLRLQHASVCPRALQHGQVHPDYEHLPEALLSLSQGQDLALRGKHQLQAKLENLEQVLKHMREAAERRQQLELEHEQALAVLNAKQQEIELLQKAQVEAKKEHEGAVQLLEAKVRELEQKCRTQSEQFKLLSRELERFRQQAGTIELLGTSSSSSSSSLAPPGPPGKSLAQLMNGIATSIGKGHDSPSGSRCVISEFIRPLQISGDKPEQLSVKPTFLSKARAGTPRCRFDSDMDNDQNSNTSKQRYSGKVHLCIARYSYNPFDGPNENPEAELPLTAGKYLYVYGDMDEDGFYEGELLDGQRGLVPSNFVDFVQDNEARLSSVEDQNVLNRAGAALEGELELSPPGQPEPGSVLSNGAGTLDLNIDEIGEDIVPYPRKITLIKQLAKSVIVGWEPPLVPPGWGTVSSYNVLVDKEVRMNIALGSRTKALIEKLNTSTCTYRISIQSITSKGSSDELQCTLLVGKDVIVAPSNLRVDNITQISAELSWLPTNSNYSHVIFLNEEEFDIVKAASYKYHFFNLKPNMAYKVKVMAKPHQMPWQLPLEQREKKEAFVEFSTLPAGPPAPPQEVSVRAGSAPGTLQVCWKPPALSATGTSHGASVTGYGVYAKGQRVAEVALPAAEGTALELARLRALDARELSVRTLSAQGESLDSAPAAIPPDLLVPPSPHPRTAPKSKPLASAGAPETKEEHFGPHFRRDESWEQTRSLSPVHGHMLEPPTFHGHLQGRRSPSPNRILPQPQGAPVPNTVAKAMAREAAQRVAESHRMERRSVFSERSSAAPYSDEEEEEDGYDSPRVKRRGASVDEFLKESELGKQAHYCLGDEYHTESSRGSDLSDILEEDEEELYSEMQLEEGGRRRLSLGSHGALKLLGNPASAGRPDRVEQAGRRSSHGSAVAHRSRPLLVPSIDGYGGHDRLSPDIYEESETDPGTEDLSTRIFVALFDYDPLTMSPNPDAAEEELPFKEGQIIKVYGDKDADGFYRGETCARVGLIPCNMVSEIQADDEEMMDQLLKQGFLPLNTPIEKIERGGRRGGRQQPLTTRRMVALYDYDPRESSPNVDVEAELTFCTGDIITVFGEIDEDGFYYGELNGQKGLVPSNFLEEVPDDVEVFLSEAPSRYAHDTPTRAKAKRVPPENTGTSRRAPSPTVHLHSGSPPSPVMGSGSPGRGRDMASKKKKGLLSKGKKLLKKLGAVK